MNNTRRNDAGIQGNPVKNLRWNDNRIQDKQEKNVRQNHSGIQDEQIKNTRRNYGKIQDKQIKNAKQKHVGNKQEHPNPEEDPRFHDTYKFLRRYRDATYSLKVVVRQMETQFRIKYGTNVDDFLDSIYAAGADLSGDDIEGRAKSIERSNRMLKLLDSSVDLLRNNHKHGEQYYWILYYAFLSPQELKDTNEIIEKLTPHISNISYRTYYRKRHAAIEALSAILWGFTAKETLDLLNKFFP